MQYGPKIVTDGLVLCLDAAEVNSYAGEPTTNNLSSSDVANANAAPNRTNQYSNIAITKEVVYYSSNRPHVYRIKSTNATGYFSMGYDSSIQNQSGSVYAFSFDYKVVRADTGTGTNLGAGSFLVYGNGYKLPTSSNIASNISSSEVELSDGWKRVTKTYTCGYTGYNQTRQDLTTGDTGDFEVLIDNIQFEDKTYSTPFADLSRSATNGWLDLSGNGNNGTLTNMVGTGVSHYRDGQVIKPINNAYLDFDGSNDYVSTSFGSGRDPYSNPISFVAWVKSDITTNKMWLDHGSNGTNQRLYSALITADNTDAFGIQGSAWSLPSNADTSKWYHQAIVMDSGTARAYYDGIAAGTKSYTSYTLPGNTIVGGRSTYYWDGKIACFSIYNKALTAAEVLSNYNATKGRF